MRNFCEVEGCDKFVKGRGWCVNHYANWRRSGNPIPIKAKTRYCSIEGCGNKHYGHGFCNKHWQRVRHHGDTDHTAYRVAGKVCSVDDCASPVKSKDLCAKHYWRVWRTGTTDFRSRRTNKPFSRNGYHMLYYPEHPNAGSRGAVAVHTVVMSEMLGRPLRKGESVHHKNGIRTDNRPENLELWVVPQKPGQRVADLIRHANWIIENYGADPSPYEDGWKGKAAERQQYLTSTQGDQL